MDIHQLWKKETAGEQKSRENIRKRLNAGASGLGEAKLEILAELIFFVLFVSNKIWISSFDFRQLWTPRDFWRNALVEFTPRWIDQISAESPCQNR